MVTGARAPAVHRAAAILEYVARQGTSSVSQIADGLGLARSSGSDLCAALEAEHMLKRHPDGRFTLGRSFSQVMNGLTSGLPLTETFIADCDKIAGLNGVTVSLETLYCGEALCLSVRHGRLSLPLTPRPGRRLPLESSSTGQSLLVGMSADQLREHFERFAGMLPFPPDHFDVLLALQDKLMRKGRDLIISGVADDRGLEVSHPIIIGHLVVGAVTATVPSDHRITERASLVDGVQQAAKALARDVDVLASSRPL